MYIIGFRRKNERKDLSNYVVCQTCYRLDVLYKTPYRAYWSSELRDWIHEDWYVSYTTQGTKCWRCHSNITPPEPLKLRLRSRRKSWKSKRTTGSDTRRISSSGKLIGNNHRKTWHSAGLGKYHKRMLHKAERQYYKRYADAYLQDPEFEPKIADGSYPVHRSIVDWHAD